MPLVATRPKGTATAPKRGGGRAHAKKEGPEPQARNEGGPPEPRQEADDNGRQISTIFVQPLDLAVKGGLCVVNLGLHLTLVRKLSQPGLLRKL